MVADFDLAKFQRVESRAVSLILASVPQGVRDEAVSNRWLTAASLLFRVYCLYQPGGSTERAMLLSHLVSPEAVKSFGAGVTMLRKWQQNFHRVRELQAALPDSSLLLKGVDQASAHLLSLYPLIGFRVNAFRNRVSLDYNPSVATVLQLVRLLQAEFEAAALTLDGLPPEKKARAAAALAHEQALTAKGVLPKASAGLGLEAQVKALEGSKGEGKGKGKKLLKGVSLKPISLVEMVDERQDLSRFACLSELGIDESWLRAAVVNAADQLFALVDSGATNALRPAKEGELAGARVIKVDLASGGTELHVNRWGALLSASPCQVIVPAGYLVQLGFGLTWRKKGCVIKRKGEASLLVTVIKGCPLIPREVGLRLLDEYESLRDCGEIPGVKKTVESLPCEVSREGARHWLAQRVSQGSLSRGDQISWLQAMCPEAPREYIQQAAGLDVDPASLSGEGTPWNRRRRRSILRAKPQQVLLHLFSGQQRWSCPGIVVEIERTQGADLMAPNVFQHVLAWAVKGVIGGVVGGPPL